MKILNIQKRKANKLKRKLNKMIKSLSEIEENNLTNSQINRIYFIGNKKYKSSTLSDVISSSEKGWWKFLGSSSLVNKNRINFDKNLLKRFYLNNGFYDVQITSSDINFIGNNQADITFSIISPSLYVGITMRIFFPFILNRFLIKSCSYLF